MILKKNFRVQLAFAHDVAASVFAWVVAFQLRFNFSVPADMNQALWFPLWFMLPLQGFIFWKSGLYRGVWHFASIPDLRRIFLAVGISALVMAAAMNLFRISVPRSVLMLNPILLIFLMGGSRLLYRAWNEHRLYGVTQLRGRPVLVLGAGETGIALLKSLSQNSDWRVVGFLDDNPQLHQLQLYGAPVLGPIESLAHYAQLMGVTQVIVAMPSEQHEVRHRAVSVANKAGVTALTVPSFEDLMSGKVSVSQIRPVEVEDLLGREPVILDNAGLHHLLGGKAILVTGAGGSIGSELCRQVARYNPALLVLLELNEYALYALEQEFVQNFPETKIACVIGDVKNYARMSSVLNCYKPTVVFHAAAYKHVPLMENGNVCEALLNNVLGTNTLVQACKSNGVEKFILISTDKAVNSTNVMGASKRMAEMLCQSYQESMGTRFLMVRFGNVLGSSGSVIPKFREQIARGGPVTVTHPDVTRYFMSIPEAAQLVMQAALMGEGGEIFVLDMGEPIRITDLAREMIRLSGVAEDSVRIEFTGLRPGEKLYEELLADDEHTLPTPHPKLRIARARGVDAAWRVSLLEWLEVLHDREESIVKEKLSAWVEDYAGDIHSSQQIVDSGDSVLLTKHSMTIH